ncbi:MAG: DUF4870 domain-containing protein [Candidatus Eisenbacteria bacterium]
MEETKTPSPTKTTMGLDENVEGLLCYLFGWLTGILFLLLEKDSKFVKFHALQSLLTFLGLTILTGILWMIPLLGILATLVVIPLGVILWVVLMYQAYKGLMFKLPIVGGFAEQQARK